jgi:hypothetical protein
VLAFLDAPRSGGLSTLAKTLVALTGGFLATLAPVALIFAVQGLAPAMFDAVFVGALNRGSGGLASPQSIIVTWVLCPALVAFLGILLVLALSPQARQVLDEEERRAFVLFGTVGIFAILPTLKTNLTGHYLQPGAFALSAASALFLRAYQRRTVVRSARLMTAAAFTGAFAYGLALSVGSIQMVQQNRLRADLALQQQLRETLDARLDANQTVLCMSIDSTARLYLMSGRRPFNRSLYFYPSVDHLFSLDDARRVLLDGKAASALVEIHPWVDRPELNEHELAVLRLSYEIIPVGPQTDHPLLVLIRHDREPVKRT